MIVFPISFCCAMYRKLVYIRLYMTMRVILDEIDKIRKIASIIECDSSAILNAISSSLSVNYGSVYFPFVNR